MALLTISFLVMSNRTNDRFHGYNAVPMTDNKIDYSIESFFNEAGLL